MRVRRAGRVMCVRRAGRQETVSIMNREGWRLAVIVSPLVLVAACGASGQQLTTGLLDQRMQAQLAPDIVAGSAVLQTLPNGVRVALLDTSLFKLFQLHENYTFEIRGEIYNIANTPNFSNPSNSIGGTSFGSVGATQANDPRILQLTGRFNF